MRKICLCGALALACAVCFAQRHTIAISPESNPGGKLFSFEEVAGELRGCTVPQRYKKSPAGKDRSVFNRGGSLYLRRPSDGSEILIAEGSEGIEYGTAVSRNEFGIDGGIFKSPDGRKIAFYRKDESRVASFPLLSTSTDRKLSIRYPMNGTESEHLGLGIYDTGTGATTWLQIDAYTPERYISNVSWDPSGQYVYAMIGDRSQHDCRLDKYSASDGSHILTVLSEHNDAWVEPYEPIHFCENGKEFIYSTDNRDGYKSLYLCNDGGIIRRLTTVDAETEFIALRGDMLYYMSRQDSPAGKQLYSLDIRRRRPKPERLSNGEGYHVITMLEDGYVDVFSSTCSTGYSLRCAPDGKVLDTLQLGGNPMADYAKCEVELGTVKSADGRYDNFYRLVKPLGFDPSRKYPLLVYVYGGPHSQMVTDTYLAGLRNWEMYMAQRGYVVYVQDNRGTAGHGADYEKAINRRCGQEEMLDQMAGIRTLMQEPWIDTERIGVSGWSYGGFMTISLMTSYPEVFKAGACGGPVIDWKWYEVMYGERYMDTPQTNPEGFALSSLMGKAARLKAPLLICQGGVDKTVLPLHSMNFVQECIENGIDIEYFIYPRSAHNVLGRWRLHLYAKFSDFFERNL